MFLRHKLSTGIKVLKHQSRKNVAAAVTGQIIRKYPHINLLAKQVGMRRVYKPRFLPPWLKKM